jgi:cytochrome P450
MTTATSLPAGPRMPRAAQTARWFARPFEFLENTRDRYGKTFTLQLQHEGDWVVVSDPESVKTVFTGSPKVLHAGEGNQILAPALGRESVLVLDREQHMAKRKLMLPAFHGERMRRFGELIAEITAEEIETWPHGTEIELLPRMQALTLEVIMRAIFGIDDARRLARLREPLRGVLAKLTSPVGFMVPMVLGYTGATKLLGRDRNLQAAHAILLEEIRLRRGDPDLSEREDILSMLIAARDAEGRPMNDDELRDQLMTLLIAGHETTATALSWAMERLVRHPDKLERLGAEVAAGEDAYLDAVIAETLRLRPVLAIVVRRLKADFQVGEYLLPEGAAVIPCIYLLHRDPEIYPDPEAFEPERFIDTPPGTYTWIPFGGGVRRCLGASFAQYEMRVVLSALTSSLRIRAAEPASERIVRRAITHSPGKGARVVVERIPGAGAPASWADPAVAVAS